MKSVIAFGAIAFAIATAVHGQTPAIDLTAIDRPEVSVFPAPDTIHGWQFEALATVTVTHLGLWDGGGDGLQLEHPIGLYRIPGSRRATSSFSIDSSAATSLFGEELLTSGVMSVGTVNSLIDGFRYVDTPDVNLVAGDTYVISYFTATDVDPDDMAFEGSFVADPAIKYEFGRWEVGPLGVPQNTTRDWLFGANFLFNPVPEPTSSLIALAALGGLLAFRRRLAFSAERPGAAGQIAR